MKNYTPPGVDKTPEKAISVASANFDGQEKKDIHVGKMDSGGMRAVHIT